jgi:hypothetical protein
MPSLTRYATCIASVDSLAVTSSELAEYPARPRTGSPLSGRVSHESDPYPVSVTRQQLVPEGYFLRFAKAGPPVCAAE